jgi:hypothetical protein
MKRTKSDKNDRKLVLDRERIRQLSTNRLKAVVGGLPDSDSEHCTLTEGG